MDYKTFGLIGHPLGHSFSQKFFNEKFASEKINATYNNFDISDISSVPEIFKDNSVCGLNVTIPYKQEIIKFLDVLDKEAAEIGSVNVIKLIRKNGNLCTKGFNTDIIGFRDSIKPHLKPHHSSALILGTGGASKAVAHCFRGLGINVDFVSRSSGIDRFSYAELRDYDISRHLIIVNTTPLGMFPNIDECPKIPYNAITPQHICFDLTYNPEKTLFLRKSQQQGALTINGMEMLIGQAVAAWKIWND